MEVKIVVTVVDVVVVKIILILIIVAVYSINAHLILLEATIGEVFTVNFVFVEANNKFVGMERWYAMSFLCETEFYLS